MIAIIILNYNTYEDTINCVESIRKTTKINYKIFVVDGCSSNDSYEILSNRFSQDLDINILQADKNLGYSYGNNFGIKFAIADGYTNFLITNSDVIFYDAAIDILYNKLINDDSVGIVAPKAYYGNGKLQHYCKNKMTLANYIMTKKPFIYFDIFGIGKHLENKKYKFDKLKKFAGAVSGCCFAIKKQVFDEQGLLDDNVFLYYEEDILAEKLRQTKLLACIEPQSQIIHYGGQSTGEGKTPFVRMHKFYSAVYYLKHYAKTSKFGLWLIKKINLMIFRKMIHQENGKKYYDELKEKYKKL